MELAPLPAFLGGSRASRHAPREVRRELLELVPVVGYGARYGEQPGGAEEAEGDEDGEGEEGAIVFARSEMFLRVERVLIVF